MITIAMLDKIKDFVIDNVGYAKFKADGTYYTVSTLAAAKDSTGRVIINFTIDNTYPANITITEVQLYSSADELWAKKAENIYRGSADEDLHYRFALTMSVS